MKFARGSASPVQRIREVFGWDGFPYALFYKAKYGLRFELGCELPEEPVRFLRAIDRARALSETVFGASQRLTVVVSYSAEERRTSAPASSFKQLSKMGLKATFDACDRVATSDEDHIKAFGSDLYRYWHSAEIENDPSQVGILLWACVAQELAIAPKLRRFESIYVVDFDQGLAANAYDDRGMDIIATDKHRLEPLYAAFNHWLLDYDRPKMDAVFREAWDMGSPGNQTCHLSSSRNFLRA